MPLRTEWSSASAQHRLESVDRSHLCRTQVSPAVRLAALTGGVTMAATTTTSAGAWRYPNRFDSLRCGKWRSGFSALGRCIQTREIFPFSSVKIACEEILGREVFHLVVHSFPVVIVPRLQTAGNSHEDAVVFCFMDGRASCGRNGALCGWRHSTGLCFRYPLA